MKVLNSQAIPLHSQVVSNNHKPSLTFSAVNGDDYTKHTAPSKKQLSIDTTSQKDLLDCGTNSLFMIFNAFGLNVERRDIDKRIRRLNSFLAPQLLVQEAQHQGLFAKAFNKSSFEEVKGEIDKGNYICALHNLNYIGHYEVVTGYRVDEDNNRFISITDEKQEKVVEIPYEEFDQKWKKVRIFGIPAQYEHFIISFSKTDNILNRDPELPAIDRLGTAVNKAINIIGKILGL